MNIIVSGADGNLGSGSSRKVKIRRDIKSMVFLEGRKMLGILKRF